ncbi:MAG: GNAT family N-acetyltransferase [Chloroflexota bacterium]|nr:GNAT family N-acetyltransferase [Chloroflexota bacterium]
MATSTNPHDALTALGAALEARQVAFGDIPRTTWDRLISRTHSPTPFSRWTFHRAWWDAYGDTAHEQYLVCVPAQSPEQIDWSAVRAIVPLMHRHEVEPDDAASRTSVRPHEATGTQVPGEAKGIFFGASYHADYASVLADPADLPAAAVATAHALASPPDPTHGTTPWDVVDLRRLRPTDPAMDALQAALTAQPGWRVVREHEDVCPVVTSLSGDWDEFLATLDKKARHEIRRKIRRAEAVGSLTIEIESPTTAAVDAFIALHRMRFGEDGLFPNNPGGERSRRFVHRLAELERNESGGGQLHVALVRCGTRLIFAALAFDDGATVFLYNAGMDPSAAEASPGISGTAMYFQNRLAAGRRRFDYLRGNERYKYEWGAVDEPIARLLVTRP